MKIRYADIFNRCEDISSYEGGRIVDEAGNSMFAEVHITKQDEPLVIELCKQCSHIIEKNISYAIYDVSFDNFGMDYTFVGDRRMHNDCGDITMNIKSVLSAYVMYNWLSDKNAERAKHWLDIYTEMLASLQKSVRKRKPTLPIEL